MADEGVPVTVIGGYLGAGKTTLVNRLLAHPGGRRLGVIVNDFGALGIDADLLTDAPGGLINLPNGCVCCTLGTDLAQALALMGEAEPHPDHVVIEASGVADPAAAAAWGTVAPFAPGAVIVLVAADQIRQLVDDRYVAREVRRQLAGPDLVLVTRTDLVDDTSLAALGPWLDDLTGGVPWVPVNHGRIPVDVILGATSAPSRVEPQREVEPHVDLYFRWAWQSGRPVGEQELQRFVDDLPAGVLRVKGLVEVEGRPGQRLVQVVGDRRRVEDRPEAKGRGGRIEVIGLQPRVQPGALDAIAPPADDPS